MIKLHIENETARLRSVILGTANDSGPAPTADQAYDPKSLEHIIAETYPAESDMVFEMTAFQGILERYGIKVYRPRIIQNLNQIFSRDIGFVIDEKFVKANILPDRAQEWQAINMITDLVEPANMLIAPQNCHIEGGDVILWNEYIFVGTYKGDDYADINTARTNMNGVAFLKESFPHRTIKEFDLIKSMTDARRNALHLDCCFQPLGKDKAIIYPGGFKEQEDYHYLRELFGPANLFEITDYEMYQMYSNVFSIAEDIVVSEQRFNRLNIWLRENGFVVEEVPYHEIGKQEGLLRCSTLPLFRD
ncbi:MAG: dimethylarginine dimethylaminohydrolase family protein [Sphingobacterium sp.]|uniref:dimethylarginine dimethylaminohydrolase family protein n=1 Tax=Sphingobacterium sp. JB170 TaxID=1434842 RepID=UPI00097F5DEB|nr:arginine deiminase-related protein [Sphingobacterium sp. JB170]SJN21189.1 NG,NG-dimethylarginine dimethylaminohydrolase 1 [Sphingobacterium sp. JB170]